MQELAKTVLLASMLENSSEIRRHVVRKQACLSPGKVGTRLPMCPELEPTTCNAGPGTGAVTAYHIDPPCR